MDPYKVLGVSYDSSDEEIKKAYKSLSRKYHPDANIGNPNQAEYEEKFKEVQQAYHMIMDQREGKTQANYGYGAGQSQNAGFGFEDIFGFGRGFYQNQGGQSYQRQESQEEVYLRSAAQYISSGYFNEGINVLFQIESSKRNGTWYYYMAYANYRIGNKAEAIENAKVACDMEPYNYQFRELYATLTGQETRYQQTSRNYGGNPTMVDSNYCGRVAGAMCLASLCCGGGGMGIPLICCI